MSATAPKLKLTLEESIEETVREMENACFERTTFPAKNDGPIGNPKVLDNARKALKKPTSYEFCEIAEISDYLGDTKWLWPDWMPMGQTTLLCAHPSMGKTFLAMHLALVVTGFFPEFPDGAVPEETGNVLWLDYEGQKGALLSRLEDIAKRTKRPLAEVARGIHIVDIRVDANDAALLSKEEEFLIMMDAAAEKIPDLKLIVVDSLGFGQPGVSQDKPEFAEPINRIQKFAEKHGAASLVLHHPGRPERRKGETLEDSETTEGLHGVPVHMLDMWTSVRGSSAVLGAIRSQIILDKPVAGSIVRAKMGKTNAKHRPKAWGWEIVDDMLVVRDVPRAMPRTSIKASCEDDILRLLAGGGMYQNDIFQKLLDMDYTKNAIDTASANLKQTGKITKGKDDSDTDVPMMNRRHVWRLVDVIGEDDIRDRSGGPGMEDFVQPEGAETRKTASTAKPALYLATSGSEDQTPM